MRHGPYARRLLAAGIVMLGTGLPLAGPAGASPVRSAVTAAPSPAQVADLTASDGASGDDFGFSVAVTADGSTALIGAFDRDGNTGAVYVFDRSRASWQQTAELTASDGASGDDFGWSVAVAADGSTALIAAPTRNTSTGAVYVFDRTRTGWEQTAELTASDGAYGDWFGSSVALAADGSTAVIGAWGHDARTGAAYVFTRTRAGWQQTAELTPSDGTAADEFGYSVAVAADGNTALIGARESGTGAAYVFARTRAGWQQTAELAPSDGTAADEFGFSVALAADGSTAVIGAFARDGNIGAAYVFARTRAGWQQTAELAPSDGTAGDHFGYSVAVTASGNTAVIGAINHDSYIGAAYVFARTRAGWQQTAELAPSDGTAGDQFGYSVAVTASGNTIVIGAPVGDGGTGATYLFAPPSWW
jgi:hypothetical protein